MKQKIFLERFRGRFKFDEPLNERTSFRIGGPAKIWIEPEDIDDLLNVFSFAKGELLDVFIIGQGTNLLVSDTGFDGIVVNLCAPYFKRICRRIGEPESIYAGAGVGLDTLRRQAQKWHLEGFEFLAGIPGSVGGALVMNAGVRGFENDWLEISDLVLDIEVLDRTKDFKILKDGELQFGYRTSNLNDFVILGANFKLKKGEEEEILKKTNLFLEKRASSQDLTFASAGCIFKNPAPDKSAGWLLEACGLKGMRMGDAQISNAHANFIINLGRASFGDVFSLIEIAKKSVKEHFGIELEMEVKVLG